MSRAFICCLIGIAMTLFAWFGPWEWPAWPAFTVLAIAFDGNDAYQELPHAARAAVLIALIIVNSGFWALVSAVLFAGFAQRSRMRRPSPTRGAV